MISPLPPAPLRGPPWLWQGSALLLGLLLSGVVALAIAAGYGLYLIPLLAAPPVALLLLRYPFGAVLLWLLVFPIFVRDPSALGRLTFLLLHRALIPGTLLLLTLGGWAGLRRSRPLRYDRVDGAILLFLLLALVNVLLLASPGLRSLIDFYDRLIVPLCMYWLVRAIGPTDAELRWVVPVAFVAILPQLVIGLLSWFAPGTLPPYWLGRVGERTTGTFGNPAVYTSTLIFLAVFLLQYARYRRRGVARALAWLGFGIAFFCVGFSFSRGSWLGGALVVAGLFLLYPRLALRMVGVGALLFALLLGTLLTSYGAYAVERVQDEETAHGRLLGNATALAMIAERPWQGWGFDRYDAYDRQFRSRVGDLAVLDDQTSHNTFLLIASELGLPALALYLFPALWWLARTVRHWGDLPRAGMWGRHFVALLWLALLDHFVVSNFMEMIHSNLFGTTIWWLALALVATRIVRYADQRPRVARGLARAGAL